MLHSSDASPPAASVAGTALLVEFGDLWGRGLTDAQKLWELFDVCEMYMYRPEEYFGAPVFGIDQRLVTPVFSTEQGLTEFMAASPEVGTVSGREGFDWVVLTGAQFFGLPVRARWLAIDPSHAPHTFVDLSARDPHPPLLDGAPPVFINLEASSSGQIFQRTSYRPGVQEQERA